jgi:hypothetical protein
VALALGLVVVAGTAAWMILPGAGGAPGSSLARSAVGLPASGGTSFGPWISTASRSASASLGPTFAPTPAGPPFHEVDLFVSPSAQPARGALPTDPSYALDPGRPLPSQTGLWLHLKAAGRIALVDGKVVVLPVLANPMLNPTTGEPVPSARSLDVGWSRWIVEPYGYGHDAQGFSYSDRNYWNLCGPGATAVALYYWQQLTGHPDVTGTEGYFLDPYAAEGVAWPSPGPTVARSGKTRIGTYWSGSDRVNGFTAHGRGYVMYLAMAVQLPIWRSPGMAVFSTAGGQPLYPTRGSSRANIQTVLNWEVSNHNQADWIEAWYASVLRPDGYLARDLQTAVMLDVGRDGVPVVAAVDVYGLPNWQAGTATPHTRHAIAIVGYDNDANPPTYTYIDTCGRACNRRAGNSSGQIHVIPQAAMVKAIQDRLGSGFVW